jgi:PDZ domain
MRTRLFSSPIVRCFSTSLAVSVLLLASSASWRASADDLGTVGIFFAQLYDPQRLPSHLGPLAVMQVMEGSPATKAGIHSGDLVIAINGAPVGGHEFADLLRKDIHGPIGGTVRLTVVKFDGSQSELALIRMPYPPHTNPVSDPFVYSVPGSWSTDPRYQFPLPFAPKLAYHGIEDVFFSPNFDYTDTPEYHSYLFFQWLDGTHVLSAEQVQSDMETYFRGLAEERGQNYGFTPDLSKVIATYKEDSATSRTFGGAAAQAFSGTVDIWDTHGKVIPLNSEVLVSSCGTSDKTILFFGASLEPRDGDMWKEIDAIRDTFRCNR